VVAPIGRTAAGLPVGMQIVAPWYHERRAIHAARLMQEVLGGYETPPGFGPS
jgi:amidase